MGKNWRLGYFCTRYNILNCQDAYFYVILSSRFDQSLGYMLLRGVIWPRLSCFFYTKYRRSHARSIVFKRDRLVRNLDKNIGARMHAGSFLKGADSSEILTKICQSSKLPVFKTQTRVGGVVVRSGSVINFELVYFPMIYNKAPPKSGAISIKNQIIS